VDPRYYHLRRVQHSHTSEDAWGKQEKKIISFSQSHLGCLLPISMGCFIA
jgi:hypothetical protein